jgi:hypothetical protein
MAAVRAGGDIDTAAATVDQIVAMATRRIDTEELAWRLPGPTARLVVKILTTIDTAAAIGYLVGLAAKAVLAL